MTPWIAACQSSLSFTISLSFLKLRVCSHSEFAQTQWHPLSQWCHSTISSSVSLFSSCPQSFPASRSFPMSLLFAPGDQSIGASASEVPVNIQCWFLLGLIGLMSLHSKELWRVFFDIIFKSRDITLLTKVCIFKAMVFPVVIYRCEEGWALKNWCFQTLVL